MSDENNSQDLDGKNPAWDPILNLIPQEFHGMLTPELKKWDDVYRSKEQELQEFEAYKALAENKVDPDLIDQALYVMQQLQTNPQEVLDLAIESFDLPYVKNGQVQEMADETPGTSEWEDLGLDITKHPQFVAMAQALEQVQGTITQQQEETQRQKQERELNEYMENLHKDKEGNRVEFDDIYVAALISAGLDGETAVKQYQQTIQSAVSAAMQANQPAVGTPSNVPAVLGGGAGSGVGVPSTPTNYGEMKNKDLNSLVQQYLKNAQSQSS